MGMFVKSLSVFNFILNLDYIYFSLAQFLVFNDNRNSVLSYVELMMLTLDNLVFCFVYLIVNFL